MNHMDTNHIEDQLAKLKARKSEIAERKNEIHREDQKVGEALRIASNTKNWFEDRNILSDVSGGALDGWYGMKKHPDGFKLSTYGYKGSVKSEVEISTAEAILLRDYLSSLDLGEGEPLNFEEGTESTESD